MTIAMTKNNYRDFRSLRTRFRRLQSLFFLQCFKQNYDGANLNVTLILKEFDRYDIKK